MARPSVSPLLSKIRRAFARDGDPERAQGMQAYMKSSMPFHGVARAANACDLQRVFPEHEVARVRRGETPCSRSGAARDFARSATARSS